MGDLFESVFFVCLLISLIKRLHIVLIKTFTMHVEDVSMEIACKSAIYEYVYQILLHYQISVRQQAL